MPRLESEGRQDQHVLLLEGEVGATATVAPSAGPQQLLVKTMVGPEASTFLPSEIFILFCRIARGYQRGTVSSTPQLFRKYIIMLLLLNICCF